MNRPTDQLNLQPPLVAAAAPLAILLSLLSVAASIGCVGESEGEVVVYSALDQGFAAPILSAFDRSSEGKTQVRAQFDIESTKTVGLVNRILAEADRPLCDVFWNNEILHTVRLQKAGLLQPYPWPVDPSWPAGYVASDNSWCGFAARARILLVNRKLLPDEDQWPRSVMDLADPKWQGKCGMARPLFGTTATHSAVLETHLGQENAEAFFNSVRENAVVLSGNKQVAQSVSAGQIAWGITDTDDAIIEKELGYPVAIVFPDQEPTEMGTLRIPNTLAILKNAPHPIAAKALAAYLVRPATEERLAMGDSAQIPLFREVDVQPRVLPDKAVRWMKTDFEEAADRWESLAARLNKIFADL